ncbi:Uncharacterized protein OBRU01_04770 [Operophtera brumata]|uniref:ZP domain-containing protein n=1 Tax=Operophtera brumata TaxID=104452 RepID=A0A0L7LNH5_OPEBR|nr:Uncharacterized protein OBRU01_04770 [Operophtera brumata]
MAFHSPADGWVTKKEALTGEKEICLDVECVLVSDENESGRAMADGAARRHAGHTVTRSHVREGPYGCQHGDPRCVYVPPSTGQTYFSFRIAYAKCGTKPDLHGQFYENTVVVQYDKDLLEVWDEAKRLRCEWFNDYEKTASKPPMVIADLDVVQLDFRAGKGPWAAPVSGIVPLGSTLTLVVAINDYRGEFDMRVKSCAASDGSEHDRPTEIERERFPYGPRNLPDNVKMETVVSATQSGPAVAGPRYISNVLSHFDKLRFR